MDNISETNSLDYDNFLNYNTFLNSTLTFFINLYKNIKFFCIEFFNCINDFENYFNENNNEKEE